MGFKTEINYILKSSDQKESELLDVEPGKSFKVVKSGVRTYVMNASIMFADYNWKILGMCVITESHMTNVRNSGFTEITATVISRFTPEESELISRIVLGAEKARETLNI